MSIVIFAIEISCSFTKDDYMIVGDTAVPVRWCAPESLDLLASRVIPLEVTKQANVWYEFSALIL